MKYAVPISSGSPAQTTTSETDVAAAVAITENSATPTIR